MNRRLIMLLLVFASVFMQAQQASDAAKGAANVAAKTELDAVKKEPTLDDLKKQVADQAVQIARLTAQVHELTFQLQLYEDATGVSRRRNEDSNAVKQAIQAATPQPKH